MTKPRYILDRSRETVAEDWLAALQQHLNIQWLKRFLVYVCPTCYKPTMLAVWTVNWTTPLPNESLYATLGFRSQLPFFHIDYGISVFTVRCLSQVPSRFWLQVESEYLLRMFLNTVVCCREHYRDYPPQDYKERPVISLMPEYYPVEIEVWHRKYMPAEWRLSDVDFAVFVDGKLNCLIETKTLFTYDGSQIQPQSFQVAYPLYLANTLKVPLHVLVIVNKRRGWLIPNVATPTVHWKGKTADFDAVSDFTASLLSEVK